MSHSMPRERDARARDRLLPLALWGIFASVLLVVAAVGLLLARPPAPVWVRSANTINIQSSDLGADWSLYSTGMLSGLDGLTDYSSRSYQRSSVYGGTVYVGASVELYNSSASASQRFVDRSESISTSPTVATVDAGEHGVLYESDHEYTLLFIRDDAVVWVYAYGIGGWEDLSGRAFSAEYRIPGDLLVLAHIVDSRI